MKKILLTCFVLGLLFLFGSCVQKDDWSQTGGRIELTVQDGTTLNNRSLPGAVSDELAKSFSLQIRDAYKNWYKGTIGDFATSDMLFAPGSYQLTAAYGNNTDLALDNPYYISEPTTVEVVANQIAQATMKCVVGNAMASFVFANPEQATTALRTYSFVTEVNGQTVSCTADDGKNPYIKAGQTALFYLKGETTAGKAVQYKFAEITDVQPSKNYRFTLTLGQVDTGNGAFDIQVEDQVLEISINETLPETFLPQPKIQVEGLLNNTLDLYETAPSNPVKCALSAYRPLEDMQLILNFADERLKALNNTYIYSKMTPQEKKTLEDNGIVLPVLNGVVTSGVLDFTSMISRLRSTDDAVPVVNQFSVRVKANGRWSNEAQGIINILKPEFTMKVFYGDIWTKELTVTALRAEDVTHGDWNTLKAQMQYQFSTDSVQWEILGADLRKAGLTPGTEYYVRPLYRGALAGKPQKVRTYEDLQALNNTLDKYSATYPLDKNPLYTFDGGWFDTRNALTCHGGGVNAFYVSKSGTLPEIDQGRSVARLMTIGWGVGNTCSFGNKGGSVIKNISAGLFCVGTYDKATDKVTGVAAPVRPTDMRFTFRAQPFGDDEYSIKIVLENHQNNVVTVIGEGFLQSNTPYTNYTTYRMPITYNDAHRDLPITHIKAEFYSGTKSDWDHLPGKFRDNWFPYSSAYICGSELWLDELSFVYDK